MLRRSGMAIESKTLITVNGRKFSSVEEMPAEVREQYERAMRMIADRDGNGVPDVLEGGDGKSSKMFTVTMQRVVVKGGKSEVVEDSPEVRRGVEKAVARTLGPQVDRPGAQ